MPSPREVEAALETSLVAQLESATGHAAELSPYTLDALLADAAATLSTLRQHIADLERRVAEEEKDGEQQTVERALRRMIADAYRAYYKPEWQEGECFDEIASDLRWEGIDSEDAKECAAIDAARKDTR